MHPSLTILSVSLPASDPYTRESFLAWLQGLECVPVWSLDRLGAWVDYNFPASQ